MIITAEKTVSRGSVALAAALVSIIDTINATSMIVMASDSTSVPNGSPTRCATTSAWWTAAITAPASATTHAMASTAPTGSTRVTTSSAIPAIGISKAHNGIWLSNADSIDGTV